MSEDVVDDAGAATEETQEEAASAPAPAPEPKIFSLPIFPMISTAQRQHGLRHNDYQRYRQYCARRLSRLRHSLHFMNGKQRFVKKEVALEKVTDARYLEIVLMDTERAWSYAMQLKEMTNPRQKFHLRSRMRKAVKHATLLHNLCCAHGICDARTELEATAYFEWIQGVAGFEEEDWQSAMLHLQKADALYEKLMTLCGKEQQELYEQRLTDMRASVKFCVYNLSSSEEGMKALAKLQQDARAGTLDLLSSKLDSVLAEAKQKQLDTVSEINWLGSKVPIKNAQAREAFSNARLKEQEIAHMRTSSQDPSELYKRYDELLLFFNDGLIATNEELNTLSAERNPSQKTEAQMVNLKFLRDYLKFMRGSHMTDRSLHMIQRTRQQIDNGKLAKPDDVVRLCDNLIQICSEVVDIEPVKDNEPLSKQYAATALYGKTLRCFYLAESFRLSSKFREALALYDRSMEHAQMALTQLRSLQGVKEQVDDLDKLLFRIKGQKISLHAAHILAESEDKESKDGQTGAAAKPLSERLNTYSADPALTAPDAKLVVMPPEFQTIPCKPLFFDLANNYLEFPDLTPRFETNKSLAANAATAGASAVSAVKGALGKLAGFGGFWGSK
eukprot:m.200713 g.200713  ORF g.200713 m.200713 type:complete len:616 (-) comp17697_c0_seq3:6002-7849(-)